MNTYYIYSPENWALLGEVQAIDTDAAELLANHVWTRPVKILAFRLQLHQKSVA